MESYVVTVAGAEPVVPFYLSKEHHVLSQFSRPHGSVIAQYDQVQLPSKSLRSIIEQYGTPHYVKIDIENYDKVLLKDLFTNKVFPPYVSAESHTIDVYSIFLTYGGYSAFKLVDGQSVPHTYGSHVIKTAAGPVEYSFPTHSAGPFGNDINGPWQTGGTFFNTLAAAGLGWKDIHVSNVDFPEG